MKGMRDRNDTERRKVGELEVPEKEGTGDISLRKVRSSKTV